MDTRTTSTGSLAEGRTRHGLEKLDDGRVIAIAGYRPSAGRLASVEIYSPGSGQWSPGPPLSAARSRIISARLTDGRILTVGGNADTASGASNLGEIFDPTTNTWSSAPFAVDRIWPGLVVLADGRAVMFGGELLGEVVSSAELFDPATDTWTALAAAPRGRHRPAGFELSPGAVLFAGGETTDGASPLVDVLLVDENRWVSGGSLESGRTQFSAAQSGGSFYLAAGCAGRNCNSPSLATVERFTALATGLGCGADWECSSTQCSDGVCCETACDGECLTCDSTGLCGPVSQEDDPDTCAGINTCSPSGRCLRRDGSECLLGGECGSGSCTDGVCCATECGECQRCLGDHCEAIVGCNTGAGGMSGAGGNGAGSSGGNNPSGGTAGTSASAGAGATAPQSSTPDEESTGCGCKTASPPTEPSRSILLLGLLGLFRRRRDRGQPPSLPEG